MMPFKLTYWKENFKFGGYHFNLGGTIYYMVELPWWLSGKESACQAGDKGLIPGLGRSPGRGHGNPLQYSCLGNPRDRGAWWDAVHGVAKESDTT